MKNLLMGIAGGLLFVAGVNGHAEADDQDAIKDAAWNACVVAASDRYESAEVDKTAKKKKISGNRGYQFSVHTIPTKRGLRCFADNNGNTMFYRQ